MPKTNLFSTTLRDGEGLEKIQAWIGQYYRDELIRFEVVRAEGDMVRMIIECRNDTRLQLVSSHPADGAYLVSGISVPNVDMLFSEPIRLDSLYGQVKINGTPVANDKLSVLSGGFKLRIDTSLMGLASPGQYSVLVDSGLRDVSGLLSLSGRQGMTWIASSQGAPSSGEQVKEKIQDRLAIARLSVDGRQSEAEMLRDFLLHKKIEPTNVVSLKYVRHVGFHTRTMIFVIYAGGTEVPEVISSSPAHGSTMIVEPVGGLPPPMNLTIHFNTPVPATPVPSVPGPPTITFDDVPVDPGSITFSEDRRVATISCTPTTFGHHQLEINELTGSDYSRPMPYLLSFTILEPNVVADTAIDELTIWEDILIQDDGMRFHGNDPMFPNTPSIRSIGTNPGDLQLIPNANVNVDLFAGATVGQNPLLTITGWSATHGAIKTSTWGVDAQGVGVVNSPHDTKFVTPFGDTLRIIDAGLVKMPIHTAPFPSPLAAWEGAFANKYFSDVTRPYGVIRRTI